MDSSLLYKIGLSLLPKIGAINARKLVAYTGSLKAIFENSKNEFTDIPGIGSAIIKSIVENRDEVLRKAEDEIAFIEKYKLKIYFYLDEDYPRRLAQCPDAPVIMYMKGNVNLDTARVISIVGTRKATEYGREFTSNLIKGLSEKGIHALIVSGLAYGIDYAAHKASLEYNLPTVGVVGHGLDTMYPASHASFAKEIVKKGGALLSDFPSNTKIDPGNFLRRNRIVAGLADCTIVVESAEKGGALVTADIANSYNRDVFAVPGRPSDKYAEGCNHLIKNNKAAILPNVNDLIEYMGWEIETTPKQQQLLIDVSQEEQALIDILRTTEIATSDYIARETDLSVNKINTLLLELEFKGVIKSLPGNRFKLFP